MDIPVPRILESLDLGLGLLTGRSLKQDVIGGVRIERRVEINQVNRFIRDALPEHGEIVTVIKSVAHQTCFTFRFGRFQFFFRQRINRAAGLE